MNTVVYECNGYESVDGNLVDDIKAAEQLGLDYILTKKTEWVEPAVFNPGYWRVTRTLKIFGGEGGTDKSSQNN